MPTRKPLNKKLNFGKKYPDKTAKEIIDLGDYKYIYYLYDERLMFFTAQTYEYIDNYKLKNKIV